MLPPKQNEQIRVEWKCTTVQCPLSTVHQLATKVTLPRDEALA